VKLSVHGFAESLEGAATLATALGADCFPIRHRHFPDGESLVQVERPAPVAILYRSLDRPNEKLVELMLAAAALRENGARRVVLVAPYLAYMRQDMAFHPGEAVSQKIIGRFIAAQVDALVTVDPHLHRVSSLAEAVPGIETRHVAAAPILAAMLAAEASPETLLVGPDSESRPWVESIARPLGLPLMVGEKQRRGDREIEIAFDDIAQARGKRVILVDDVISSGSTLRRAAQLLQAAGAQRIEVVATHCLASPADLNVLAAAGIARIRATDSVPGPHAAVSMVPAIAEALQRLAILNEA
jgi:ribose-phosphate pyrophosphokinase